MNAARDEHAGTWTRAAWLLPVAVLLATLAAPPHRVAWEVAWVPSLDVDLAFALDGLSRLFLLIAAGIGVAVFFYVPGYLHGHGHAGRLVALLTAFLAAMAGSVLADDFIVLFLFWEATSLLSFLLIGFDHENADSRSSAQRALLITAGTGLALLLGLLLLLDAEPGLRVGDLARLDPATLEKPQFQAGVALVAVAALAKSAQFPLHLWLPGAMAAPAPVSAYLHSATMVNLGVYLLARFDEAMGEVAWWSLGLATIGSVTALWGALQGLRERDLKRILAWSTVSALGTLTLLIGLPNEIAALAFVAFVLAHALYKAPLFFIAGSIDHSMGTRVIDRLRGLRHVLPITATAAVLAALSMAGLPSTAGFLAKDTIKAAAEIASYSWLLGATGLLVSAIGVAVASVVAVRVFFGRSDSPSPPTVREELRLTLPPLLVAAAGVFIGLRPALIEPLLLDAARVIAPSLDRAGGSFAGDWLVRAESWLLTLAVGAAIYARWDPIHAKLEFLNRLEHWAPGHLYEHALAGVKHLAGTVTRTLHDGPLSRYLAAAAAGALALAAFWALELIDELRLPQTSINPGTLLGCGVAVAGAALAVLRGDTLQRVLGAGLVGLGSAIVFLFGGAPDLAMTQLLVEVVFVVVVATALPRATSRSAKPRRSYQGFALAVAFGATLAILSFALLQRPLDGTMARYFLDNSVPSAHGQNVVNVIIVDFRGLDTLGEIVVVLLALLASAPLIERVARLTQTTPRASIILERCVSGLYWLLMAASVWLLLRGHNAPGGGFIAALVGIGAASAYAFVFGAGAARERLSLEPLTLSVTGLALAVASGLPALMAGEPFLTHSWAELPLPGIELKVSTVMLFDLGVMLCVAGALGGLCLRLREARA